MAIFNVDAIKDQAKKNFGGAWETTANLIPQGTEISLPKKGKPHPVKELIQKSREIFLGLGFDEVENYTILPDTDVMKQYGPEGLVILDRVFFLAELPRPDIGLSDKKISQAQKIAKTIETEALQSVLRSYKRGEIEADDLMEVLITKLRITDHQAMELLDKVFPELREIHPIPSNKTLRSHMTATWFHTLAALQNKEQFPLALFSVGPRYRNEQREDAHHLRVHHSASMVIMDPEISLEAGRKITEEIFHQYGFAEVKFETKKATSKYYAPRLEQEVFIKFKGEWLEIADIGVYSPIALANFNIKYPVFNAGLGIERMAMLLYEADDVRKLAYPQFSVVDYSDDEIADSLTYIESPHTERGKKIAQSIEKTAQKHKDELAPCEFTAWKDKSIEVKIIEEETGKKLIGPAGFNEICVANGTIYSDFMPSGRYTGMNYMKAIAAGAAAAIENSHNKLTYQIKTIRHLSDLNLQIPERVLQYIEGQQKKIGVGGAVFITIKAEPRE